MLCTVFSGQPHPLVSDNGEAFSRTGSLQEETIWMLSEPHRAKSERENEIQDIARSFRGNTGVKNEEITKMRNDTSWYMGCFWGVSAEDISKLAVVLMLQYS